MNEWDQEWLATAAENTGLSPERLAHALDYGVETGQLVREEDGTAQPSPELIEEIGEAFKAYMYFRAEMSRTWRLDLGEPTVMIAPGQTPLDGVLAISRRGASLAPLN